MCVYSICSCICMSTKVCMSWWRCGSQRTTLRCPSSPSTLLETGSLSSCSPLAGAGTSQCSPVPTLHLAVRALGLQICATVPNSMWILRTGTQVLVVKQQVLFPLNHLHSPNLPLIQRFKFKKPSVKWMNEWMNRWTNVLIKYQSLLLSFYWCLPYSCSRNSQSLILTTELLGH